MIYKGSIRAHSRYRQEDILLQEKDSNQSHLSEMKSNRSIANGFYQDEQDIEMEEQQQQELKDTNIALRKIYNIMETIEPILFDVKDGTLKRVAQSNFVKRNSRLKLDDLPENLRTTAMFNEEDLPHDNDEKSAKE